MPVAVAAPAENQARTVFVVALTTAVYCVGLALFHALPRYDGIVLPLVLYGSFRAMDRLPSRLRSSLVIVASLLGAILLQLWSTGYEGRSALVGGIFPWSDSGDFLSDALRLAHGERFTAASSRRPLFPALLAALLRISGDNLRLSIASITAMQAVAVVLPVRAIWRTHGFRAAFVVALLLLFFARHYAGCLQSEHVGFAFACAGFALLWRAAELPNDERAFPAHLFTGTLAVTLGLVARAGPFFLLLGIVYWGVFAGKRRALPLALGIAAIALGFLLNKLLLESVGSGVTFSDYPPIFYGMLHGEDFTLFAHDHPEIAALPTATRVPAMYRVIAHDMAAHPFGTLVAFAQSFAFYFVSPHGLFSCIWTGNPDDHILEGGVTERLGLVGALGYWIRSLGLFSLLNSIALAIGGALFALSTPFAFVKSARSRMKRDAHESLLFAATIGTFASAPFLPVWITEGHQTQTTSLVFLVALVAVVLFRPPTPPTPRPPPSPRNRLLVGFALATCMYVALVVGVAVAPFSSPEAAPCSSNGALVHPLRGASVQLTSHAGWSLHEESLAHLNEGFTFTSKHWPELERSIAPHAHDGTRLAAAFNACTLRYELLVEENANDTEEGSWGRLKGAQLADERIIDVRDFTPAIVK